MCCRQFSLNLEVELDNDPGTFGGLATNRKCTDVFALIIMVLFFGAVIGLSAYCISNSEIEKVLNGYDDCGNICGKNNIKIESMPSGCTAKNMEQKKYVLIREDAAFGRAKECVENCTMRGTSLVHNYCITDKKFIPFFLKMEKIMIFCVPSCATIAVVALCSNLIKCPLFRTYKPIKSMPLLYLTVWFLLFCNENYRAYLYNKIPFIVVVTISVFVFTGIVLDVILSFFKEHSLEQDLVAQLFDEVYEVMDVRIFCLLPIFSSIMITGSVIAVFYCCLWLQSFSYPDQIYVENESRLSYVQYPIAKVTMGLVIYALCLLYEFLKNCQCMIVGGYVAQRYFAGSDGVPPDPIKRSLANLLKYHLGSVCCGSLLLPIIYVLRAFANAIQGAARGYNTETVCTCSCRLISLTCLGTFKPCLGYFSQNSFIVTAVNGCTFCAGTIRAHKLFSHNSFNVASINSFGDWFLEISRFSYMFLAFVVCVAINLMTKEEVLEPITFITCTLPFSYILADCLTSVLKITKDTIFLCFCEDCLYNNGTSKPYMMSKNFAQLIENANKFVNEVKWKDVADKWEKGPRRLY